MNPTDLTQEIDELQHMKDTLEELTMLVEEMIERVAAKQYQLELDFNS